MAKTATQKKFVKQTALMNQKKLVEQADSCGKKQLKQKSGRRAWQSRERLWKSRWEP